MANWGSARLAFEVDPKQCASRIAVGIRRFITNKLRRRGALVAMSGGLDSSVTAALCTLAVGSDRVVGLLLPERESDPQSGALAEKMANQLGIRTVCQEIDSVLQATGCFTRRDGALASVIPDYDARWRCKLVVHHARDTRAFAQFHAVVQSPSGETRQVRLPYNIYLEVVAATSFKQRVRKMFEYYYADVLHYAVVGTANRLEHELGFFVKNGDGAADLKPIVHLYKTQVYHLAEHLKVPEAILNRTPTTDTYSLPQSQEEFFFGMPLQTVDFLLYARSEHLPEDDVAAQLGLTVENVYRLYAILESTKRAAGYLHESPLLISSPYL